MQAMQSRLDGGRSRPHRALWLAGAVAALLAGVVGFRAGTMPEIRVTPGLPGIGPRTPVEVAVRAAGRGLGAVSVELLQGSTVYPLAARRFEPRPPWDFWSTVVEEATLSVEAGSEVLEGLAEGEAVVRVTAERPAAWLRHPAPAIVEVALPVRLTPPRLEVLSSRNYVAQGGAAAVVYGVGPAAVEDGVCVADRRFPGHPLGKTPGRRLALFAVPFDLATPDGIALCARDALGNEARVAFVDRLLRRPFRQQTLEISDSFLERVVPSILSHAPGLAAGGTLLESYLAINRELRAENAAELRRLAGRSRPELLWTEPFLALPGAQVMAAFADRRTYRYRGREIDRQEHLGYDLASVRRAPVPAANDGIVLLARYFGIYGNAVVLDHGYGLMSLYGHLSSIAVQEGEKVARGQVLGRTGATGLAGGDHLHFTMLVGGFAVDPLEWWDARWVRDRLQAKLAEGVAPAGPGS